MKLLISLLICSLSAFAQISPDVYHSLHWRSIGPHRAGRISAVAGVPSQVEVFYVGTPGGGLWKTDDAGQTWRPITDSIPVAPIGSIAVSPSNPNIIYIGTGEMYASSGGTSPGKGVFKSTDAGKTWFNVGLTDTHLITALCIDPKNPDIVIAAVTGDAFSGTARGIYKTTDGGKNWKKTFFKDQDWALIDMNMANNNSKVMYASTGHRPVAPPNPNQPPNPAARREQDAAIYRSTDEGSSWTQVGGKGLPSEPWGRVGVAGAPGAKSKTVYAIVSQGFFRSDDMGENWTQTTKDPRVVSSGYFGQIFVDPNDGNSVYVGQTSMYRTTDGGKIFAPVFGAPSGDDYHLLWINPANSNYMMAGVDQGAVISVNHGDTWSSWYNMPNGQFYHVTTDNRFPYYVYAAQQDSGTAAVASRSDFGEITDRDWAPTGGFEFSFIAPDPINKDIVYIGGWYGSIIRFDRTTGQVNPVFVRTPKYRTAGMAPLAFSPQDNKTLYVGAQFMMRSDDHGDHWSEISPDLTKIEPAPGTTQTPADRARNNNATISSMSLSPAQENLIWAGTSNGVIQLTRDGKTWQNVTPAGLPERSFINELEASPHDPATAYAVIDAQRDVHPLIYRTHDFGKTWQLIVNGISPDFIARVVREDPVNRNLLYAGTEDAPYVSFDGGDHWQTLRLDMPVTPVRDMKIKGDDLVVATYGRSLYILDDVTPLRQLTTDVTNSSVHLFTPEKAWRVRWDNSQDTPLPKEVPAGENPLDGAIIDYYLKSPADAASLKLQIFDAQHNLVREYTTKPDDYDRAPKNVPDYWFEEPATLTNKAGINRFAWDFRYPAYRQLRYSYYGNTTEYIEYTLADHTIPGKTPHDMPQGPLAVPGDYTVELTVGAQTYKQPLTVVLDPRVHASTSDLQLQLDTERDIAAQMSTTYDGFNLLQPLYTAIEDRKKALPPPAAPAVTTGSLLPSSERQSRETSLAQAVRPGDDSIVSQSAEGATQEVLEFRGNNPKEENEENEVPQRRGQGGQNAAPANPFDAYAQQFDRIRDGSQRDLGIGPINRELNRLAGMIGSGDGRPAGALVDAVHDTCQALGKRLAQWKELVDSPSFAAANTYLQEHKLAPLPNLPGPPAAPACK